MNNKNKKYVLRFVWGGDMWLEMFEWFGSMNFIKNKIVVYVFLGFIYI